MLLSFILGVDVYIIDLLKRGIRQSTTQNITQSDKNGTEAGQAKDEENKNDEVKKQDTKEEENNEKENTKKLKN